MTPLLLLLAVLPPPLWAWTGGRYEVEDTCPEPAPPLPTTPELQTCDQFKNSLTDEEDMRPGQLARRMCRKHQEDLCALPKRNKYYVCPASPSPADILEFPHMALLGYKKKEIRYACGGSLIAPDFILTAAHCSFYRGVPLGWVLLGSTNRTSKKPQDTDAHQLIQVAEVIMHPEYNASVKYHDIALLRLARPAQMEMNKVYPACLDTDMDVDNTGRDAVATGWGSTSWDQEGGSHSLLKVKLTVRDMQYCRDNLASSLKVHAEMLPRGLLDATQLCAGGGRHNRDTCQGDSGGPLQVKANPAGLPCIHRIIGVVSFGQICGLGYPGVYTRVSAYVPWIESVVWPPRLDGCVENVRIKEGNNEGRVPNTGPGTVARGMCRVYHSEFCFLYDSFSNYNVKPELTSENACHHNHGATKGPLHPVMLFKYGNASYNRRHHCAGALVSPNTVLTAARCTALDCLPLTSVLMAGPAGGACKMGVFLTEHHFIDYESSVEKITVHPEYLQGRAYADLAIVTLTKAFDLRDILPHCINTVADVPIRAGLRATAAGWNVDGTWETMSLIQPNNTLTVRSSEQCSAALMEHDTIRLALPHGYSPSLLCAGGLCDNETYAGDAGTPLVANQKYLLAAESGPDGDMFSVGPYAVDYVLGVATSLEYCTVRDAGGHLLPDLFADVRHHIDWIESTVWPN